MRNFFLFLAILPVQLWAQQAQDSLGVEIPRLTLKTNVTHLINPFKSAFVIGADYRVAPKLSVDLTAGAVLGSGTFATRVGESYAGPRVRAGLKFFPITHHKYGYYFGLETRYEYIRQIKIRNILRQGNEYQEIYRLLRTVSSYGVSARTGWAFYLGKDRRVLLEPYTGLGLVLHSVKLHLPPDAELVSERSWLALEFPEGSTVTGNVMLGMHLGVIFW